MTYPTSWTTALKQTSGVQPIVEVILDPDGKNIKLDGFNDIKSMTPISNIIELDPYYMEQITLQDVWITFNDSKEFLLSVSWREGYRPLRSAYTSLHDMPSSTVVRTRLHAYPGQGFRAGDMVKISDGVNTETKRVESTSTGNYPSITDIRQIITLSSPLENTYAENSLVAIDSILGAEVSIRLRLDGMGCSDSKEIFRGIIRQPFQWSNGEALLKIDNIMGVYFNQEARIVSSSPSPTQRMNTSGSLASTISWTGTGSGTLSAPTIYAGATLGYWIITFSDATNFTVTGPNCNAKVGTTGSDFYDQTDATDSQICIPSANWGGTPDADDTVGFYVSINFENMNAADIIYSICSDYAGISDNYIDVAGSFTVYGDVKYWDDYKLNLSFSEPKSIAELIETIRVHQMLYVTQDMDCKVRLVCPMTPLTYVTASDPGRQIMNTTSIKKLDLYNEIVINYGYNHSTSAYQYQYKYPLQNNKSQAVYGKIQTLTLNMPGYYSESDVEIWAKRYYHRWAFGMDIMTTEYGLRAFNANIGYSTSPKIGRLLTPYYFPIHGYIIGYEYLFGNTFRIRLVACHTEFWMGVITGDEFEVWEEMPS